MPLSAQDWGLTPEPSTSAPDTTIQDFGLPNQPVQSTPAPDPSTPQPPPAPIQRPNSQTRYAALFGKPSEGMQAAESVLTSPGIIRGMRDVGDTLAKPVDILADWADQHVPVLGSLDRAAAAKLGLPTPQQNLAAMDQARAAYDAGPGQEGKNQAGRFIGQSIVLGPMMRALGVATEAIPEVGPFLAGQGGSAFGVPGRMASLAAQGAGMGGASAALTSSQSNQPVGEQIARGALTGAIANPLLGIPTGAVIPQASGPRADLAREAVQTYGIPLRPSQISGNPTMAKAEQISGQLFGGGPIRESIEDQNHAFTKALSNTWGGDATGQPSGELTPATMQGAKDRIGSVFNDVAARSGISGNANVGQLAQDLGNIATKATLTMPQERRDVILKQIKHIAALMQTNNGTLPGDAYQSLTSKGGIIDTTLNSPDSDIRQAAGAVRNALDDALERSAAPGDMDALRQARQQYKNLMTVAPLVVKGEPGEVTPTSLQSVVNRSYKQRAFRGAGDIGTLADIGKTLMVQPKDSGTPLGNLFIHGAEGLMGGLVGHGMSGEPASDMLGIAGGVLGSSLLNNLAARALTSQVVRDRLLGAGLGPRSQGFIAQALQAAPEYIVPALASGVQR